MRLGFFLSLLLFPFSALAQSATRVDTSHYFSIYPITYLKDGNDWIYPDHFEPSPDGTSYLAVFSGELYKTIWTSPDGLNWREPHSSLSYLEYDRLIEDAPGNFSISDLKFSPLVSYVTLASWNREPLLSFYLYSDMHFINPTTGFMIADKKLYQTTDAGNHWMRLLDSNKFIDEIFYDKKYVYVTLQDRDYVKIDLAGNILKVGRFKSGKHIDYIKSIQFQNDTIAYYLIASGTGKSTLSLFKSTNDVIARKPLLRSISSETELVVNNESIVVWNGKKSILKSDDGGDTWVHYSKKNENYLSAKPLDMQGIFIEHDSIIMGFSFSRGASSSYISVGKVFFDTQHDSSEVREYSNTVEGLIKLERSKQDSIQFCKCKEYASSVQNHRQIENGTFYQTEVKYLMDKVPTITLKDGTFSYDPKSFYKESTIGNSVIPKTSGTYIAGENTVTFSTGDIKNFFNGTFHYLFDGDNFWIYKCDKVMGQTDRMQFFDFEKEDAYLAPVLAEKPLAPIVLHASGYVYSFIPDTDKFVITLVDTLGRRVENASIKYDDIYATPFSLDRVYYFDKRTLKEFQQVSPNPAILIISHPDYDPMVVGFSAGTKKYILKRKKKK